MRKLGLTQIFESTRLLALALLIGALCVGCSDDSGDGDDTTGTTTETGTGTVSDDTSDTTTTDDTDTSDDTQTADTADTGDTTDTDTDTTDTDVDTDVTALEVGYSLFVVCAGVNHDYTNEFDGGHDIIVSPYWDQSLSYDLIRDSEIELMGYAILNYSAVDNTAAPKGKNSICVSAMLMYDWENEWHWSDGYDTYKDFKYDLGLILLERAEQDALPNLLTHVEVMEVLTPQTLKGFTSNPKGSIFGWHMTPEQSLDNRLPAQTPIDNLVLSSAWTFPGGGQSAVLASGQYAMMEIMRKETGSYDKDVVIPDEWVAGQNVEMFEDLGIYDKVKKLHLDPMYQARYPGDGEDVIFNIPADEADYKAMLQERFPEESDDIDRLWKKIKRIDEVLRVIFAFQKAGKDIGGDDAGEFLGKITELDMLEDLMEVQTLMTQTTLSEFLADYIDDEELIAVFTQLSGFAGTGPDDVSAMFFIAMWTSYHLGGYYYFEGGSQAVSDAMAEVIEENAGVIRLHSRAERIEIGDDGLAKRVITDDGVCYNAKYVVSNANAPDTMLKMVGEEYLPTDPTSLYHPDSLKWENGGYDYPGNPLDATPPENVDIDVVTSATPGVESAILTESNHAAGYGKAGCTGCHDKAHGGKMSAKYTDAECTTCHGQNGATKMPNDHALTGCAKCHGGAHKGLGYTPPTDCRGCHRFTPPAGGGCATEEDYDLVVIGAGGGGLSAAALLAQKGLSVVVLEQHHKVGGYMTNFDRGPYRFEVSLHAFDGLNPETLK